MSTRIRFKQRITKKKTGVFFLSSARIGLLPISEKKQFISRDKKTFRKKHTFISRDENIFPAMFFLLVFFIALINFLSNRSKVFFISSPSLTFLEICQMFFCFTSTAIVVDASWNGRCDFDVLNFFSETSLLRQSTLSD